MTSSKIVIGKQNKNTGEKRENIENGQIHLSCSNSDMINYKCHTAEVPFGANVICECFPLSFAKHKAFLNIGCTNVLAVYHGYPQEIARIP